ncbi:hypothetical protein ABZV75_39780 [Streptomyces flaveolus]|uniref:hypothetical protein n=1 Tax=Streptomyces flaveolus TaxID=67297 RepID=UPI0033B1AB9A
MILEAMPDMDAKKTLIVGLLLLLLIIYIIAFTGPWVTPKKRAQLREEAEARRREAEEQALASGFHEVSCPRLDQKREKCS